MKRISFLAFLAASLAASVHAHESSIVSSYSRISSTDSLPNAMSSVSSGSDYDFSEELTSEPFEDAFVVVNWPEIDLLDDDDEAEIPSVTIQSTRADASAEHSLTYVSSSFGSSTSSRSVPAGDGAGVDAAYYHSSESKCNFAALECKACARCATDYDEDYCKCIDSDTAKSYDWSASDHDICVAIGSGVRYSGLLTFGSGNDCLAIAGRMVQRDDDTDENAIMGAGDDTVVAVQGGRFARDITLGSGNDTVSMQSGSVGLDVVKSEAGGVRLFVAENAFLRDFEGANEVGRKRIGDKVAVIAGHILNGIALGQEGDAVHFYMTSTGFVGGTVKLDPDDDDDLFNYARVATATGSFIGSDIEFDGIDDGEFHIGGFATDVSIQGTGANSKNKLDLYSDLTIAEGVSLIYGSFDATAHNRLRIGDYFFVDSTLANGYTNHLSVIIHDDVFMDELIVGELDNFEGEVYLWAGLRFNVYAIEIGNNNHTAEDLVTAIFAGGVTANYVKFHSARFAHVEFGEGSRVDAVYVNYNDGEKALVRFAPGCESYYVEIIGETNLYVAGSKVLDINMESSDDDDMSSIYVGGSSEVGYIYSNFDEFWGFLRVWVEEYSHAYEVSVASDEGTTECEFEKADGVLVFCDCDTGCPQILVDDEPPLTLKRDEVRATRSRAGEARRRGVPRRAAKRDATSDDDAAAIEAALAEQAKLLSEQKALQAQLAEARSLLREL